MGAGNQTLSSKHSPGPRCNFLKTIFDLWLAELKKIQNLWLGTAECIYTTHRGTSKDGYHHWPPGKYKAKPPTMKITIIKHKIQLWVKSELYTSLVRLSAWKNRQPPSVITIAKWPSNSTPRYKNENLNLHQIYTPVFMEALLIVNKKQKCPKYPQVTYQELVCHYNETLFSNLKIRILKIFC